MPHATDVSEKKMSQEEFIAVHGAQLSSSVVPEILWPTLHEKLANEILDAGSSFKLLCYMDEEDNVKWKVVAEKKISCEDPNQIYLIDHAWTYQTKDARLQLQMIQGLMERMAELMKIDTEQDNEEIIEEILTEMWKYNQTYSFGHLERGSDEAMPLWYIMDEFGSRIQHSSTPSFRTAPFYYAPLQISFTLLWPVQDLEEGGEVTRNFVENVSNQDVCQCRLLPWQPCDLKQTDYEQKEPDISYFLSHKQGETLPDMSIDYPGLSKDRNVKVFLSYQSFPKFLTDGRFELVETMEEADIIWCNTHWKDYKKLSEETPGKFVNQFPCECVVTVKDMLAVVCRRAGSDMEDPETMETDPAWLPRTYNLQTELPLFVSYFQNRKEKGLDNHWICKPWNLARGLDMHITSNLNQIVRLPESGPKVACKYVEDPVLFHREEIGDVKFDIRYIVLLSSVQPLKLYVYRVFWLRFANKTFSLDHFDDYEKHFTVMNYVEDGQNLKQINYDDFIPMFDSQYPDHKWSGDCGVEESIFQMFREMFEAASCKPAPAGIAPSPQSRAMYAVDLLLKWKTNTKGERTMQPVVCEVNFSPDCDRACKYHPNFVNDVFSTLFLDDIEGRPVTLL
ncbi:tubulin--tyrosine ligase-like protein 12 [Mytilus edulis]|uniref:tubulin--tyrosine ligase-like protein 12 n=1 Tax=Mytilus edulis TaxID=6550 RepID=UPI0039F0D953